MKLIIKILTTIIFVILATYVLSFFKNNSNFPKIYVIPIIVAALTKYILGDFDEGYQWSLSDVLYWIVLLCVSYQTLVLIN